MPVLPDLATALASVRDRLGVLDGMWPAVSYRVIGRTTIESLTHNPVEVLAAHFQASPTPQAPECKVRLNSPLAIEGVATIDMFDALLKRWQTGDDGLLDHWLLRPPAITPGIGWDEDVTVAPEQYPLIEVLPDFPTRYRESRLVASGGTFDNAVSAWLHERMADLSSAYNPAVFWRDYLDWPWGMQCPLLAIHLPLAVGMTYNYSSDRQAMTVEIHHRPPLKAINFALRVGSGPFDASLPTYTPQRVADDEQRWDVARVEVQREKGGTAKAWLTLLGATAEFGWELTADLGRRNTPEYVRRGFLADWYALGNQNMGAEVDVRLPGTGRKDRPSDAFELALANALGALGYGVLFAGHILKTQAIDVIGFDAATRRAYVVSATISNDVDRKLKSWLDLEAWVRSRLEPTWQVRPVIVTTQPYSSLTRHDLATAAERRVLVLTAESLDALKESEPDLDTWAAHLAADVVPLAIRR